MKRPFIVLHAVLNIVQSHALFDRLLVKTTAIAMCVFKDYHPGLAIPFAADLQYALHEEGRDLTDDEAYRHLLEKYKLSDQEFFTRLHSAGYKEKAYEEFALIKQLGVTGFPTVFLQVSESRVYLLCRGYTDFTTLQGGIERALEAAAKEVR